MPTCELERTGVAVDDLVDGVLGHAPYPIRAFIENALCVNDLKQLYRDAVADRGSAGITESVLKLLDISIRVSLADLAQVPRTGPVVVVANHPFGLLDGLLLDAVLHRVRPDCKILTNSVLCAIPEVSARCLPVDILSGQRGVSINRRSMRAALAALEAGGLIGLFPAGEVAHWSAESRRVIDPKWSETAARLALHTGAAVVPVYFSGTNSLMFQLAGLVHSKLRTMGLARELMNKRGGTHQVRIGRALPARSLQSHGTAEQITEYLRARTYLLSHRRDAEELKPPPAATPIPARRESLEAELARLGTQQCLVQTEEYSVCLEQGHRIPVVLDELGRLREQTFRSVGEGTGKAKDLDQFDPQYWHLVLWRKSSSEIAGAYRLAWTRDILPQQGVAGLYTSTLFRYARPFFDEIGPAVEVGRSFVVPQFQKDFAPLLLLWQGLGRAVARRPESPTLFGAVSISDMYTPASKELIVRLLQRRQIGRLLPRMVEPRHPFQLRLTKSEEICVLSRLLLDIDDLNTPIRDIEQGSGVPVLLRQYLKLGGQVIAFNVDPDFSQTVDGLLVVDLRHTHPRLLDKYLGPQGAAEFLRYYEENVLAEAVSAL